jgi:hypothetical protein
MKQIIILLLINNIFGMPIENKSDALDNNIDNQSESFDYNIDYQLESFNNNVNVKFVYISLMLTGLLFGIIFGTVNLLIYIQNKNQESTKYYYSKKNSLYNKF